MLLCGRTLLARWRGVAAYAPQTAALDGVISAGKLTIQWRVRREMMEAVNMVSILSIQPMICSSNFIAMIHQRDTEEFSRPAKKSSPSHH
eukprot:scaffold1595_cov102-Skeletonema_dohrnii-CCMP3373.AAC.5